MDLKLNDLKSNFSKIIVIKDEINKIFDVLELKISKLKDIYGDFIKNNKHNLFVFGLDSFHFQGKMIDIEFEDMKRLFAAISNRIYCEYFKFNNIIIQYIEENIDDKKMLEVAKVNNYPIYKDLEPFKIYDFDIIQDIHENIINSMNSINMFLKNKNYELKSLQVKNNIGFNIDNFVHTFNFNNIIIKEKLLLFVTYVEFFHRMHTKYLKRFSAKMQLMYTQINNDIKFDESEKFMKGEKKDIMKQFQNESDNISETISEIGIIINNNLASISNNDIFIKQQKNKSNDSDNLNDSIQSNKSINLINQNKDEIDDKDGIDNKDWIDNKDGINNKDWIDEINNKDGIDGINNKDGIDGIDNKDNKDNNSKKKVYKKKTK